MKDQIRIGCGAGFSGDRLEPAVVLAEKAELDYLVLECLAERTIALAQKRKLDNSELGYDPLLERRISSLLPHLVKNNITLITNMGAANPISAAKKVKELAQNAGFQIKVAAVFGDDVLNQLTGDEITLETKKPIKESGPIVSANAYLGVEGILEALTQKAQIIITGRVADPSLFLAPMMFEFGWTKADSDLLGKGTVIGHLLECAGQLTGGYFMDAGRKQIPDPANLRHPFAVISDDGSATFSKVKGTGGKLSLQTAKEQLLYEVVNPYAYQTPDVTADFSTVSFEEISENVIGFHGGGGTTASQTLKVSVGYRAYYLGEGEISYTGYDALERAQLAANIIEQRLLDKVQEIRVDYIGQNSIHKGQTAEFSPSEIRLRIAANCETPELARLVGEEVEALYTNGPAGGGGVRKFSKEVIGIHSILMDRNLVTPQIEVF
ncbi:acyclic terpene utilization AtuA family protein [Jiulongibacter sediminis]|jgi:hypothetical protein|uniref:acyclic terpene utilization AtuA family protein n=1 Tax=Jiulongibacter sediminis TaxID=1605367 RepID=UPI0026F04E45|nr:acyclic terpene utilization AtuA family protein [Jiulongibacter sediminis]